MDGVAVENAQLYNRVERQRDELRRAVRGLEAASEIARAVGGETDLERILEIVVKRGRALVEARSLLILLARPRRAAPASIAGEREAGRCEDADPDRRPIPGQVLEAATPPRVHDLDPSLMARPGSPEPASPPSSRSSSAAGARRARRLEPLGRERAYNDEGAGTRSFAASAATAVATAQSVAEDRARESIEAAERERGRWARELHDETLQNLAGLRVLLSAARRSDPRRSSGLVGKGIAQSTRRSPRCGA